MSMPTITTNKGAQLQKALKLVQYENSPILDQYISAYTGEMDWLFENIEAVYLGRMLEYAVGANLDVIGVILDEPRTVVLPTQYFGFKDESSPAASNIAPLADEVSPSDGGVFRDEEQGGGTSLPLGDAEYRRLLMAKAFTSNREDCSIDGAYKAISMLLGKTPATMRLITSQTDIVGNLVTGRNIKLEISRFDTTLSDDALITYFGKYIAPMGSGFAVTRI